VLDPTHQGIHIEGNGGGVLTDVLFENVTIENPSTYGVQVEAGAAGSATFRNVTIVAPGVASAVNEAGAAFTIDDSGGNNW
jgi:hypothetical protein